MATTWHPPKMKSVSSTFLQYIKLSAETGVKLPEMEAFRPFLGKKGQPLKRQTRSKRQQVALEQAVKDFRAKYGRGGKKKIQAALQDRKSKNEERFKKARDTFRQHQKERAGAGANFRSVAQKASKQYGKMVEAFSNQTLAQLIDRYNIGSGIIQWMAEKGLTIAEMERLIELFCGAWDDLPAEAQELAQRDDYWQIALDIMQSGITEDFGFMLQNYLDQQAEGRGGDYINLLNEYGESGSVIPFAEIWEKLQAYDDPYNPDNLYEVMEGLEDE